MAFAWSQRSSSRQSSADQCRMMSRLSKGGPPSDETLLIIARSKDMAHRTSAFRYDCEAFSLQFESLSRRKRGAPANPTDQVWMLGRRTPGVNALFGVLTFCAKSPR